MLKIAWHPAYAHPLPEGHRFPMEKYNLLPEQLKYEGTVTEQHFFAPSPLDISEIIATHCPGYWKKLQTQQLSKQEERRTGFPQSPGLIQRERIIMGGTVEATEYALKHGIAMNIAGGTHHAHTDRGEGFCLLNDIALGANYLLKQGKAKRIMVIDLDVHQGNGTAEIFADNPMVFTFSMHGKNNYPMHKEQSDLDVELPDHSNDQFYLQLLEYHLPRLLDSFEPDFLFFQSGVDVLGSDKLGRLGLSIDGCRRRDRLVLENAYRNKLPIVASMGGGYSPVLRDIIEAHANTYRLAQEIFF